MKHFLWIIGLLVVVSTLGCGSTKGVKIDSNKLDQIKQGVTTKSEVLSMLGTPTSTTKTNNIETFTYSYLSQTYGYLPGMGSAETQNVMIMFDEKGVVQSVSSGGHKY